MGSGGLTAGIYAWHGNVIYGLTAPPAWTAVHTTTSQYSNSGYGWHSGLYAVHSRDGTKMWICGIYRASTSTTLGWVKLDTETGAWTSGTQVVTVAQARQTNALSPCVQFEGELVTVCRRVATFFDPETDTFRFENYAPDARSTGWKDKVWIRDGNLVAVGKRSSGSGDLLQVHVRSGGIWSIVGTLGRENSGNLGDWDIWSFNNNSFFVSFYTTLGGTGWRLFEVVLNGSNPLLPATLTEYTNPVIPAIYRWPSGASAQNDQRWQARVDFTDWKRGAFGAAGGTFSEIFLQPGPGFTTKRVQWGWGGVGATLALTSDHPGPPGQTDHSPAFALSTNRWGLADRAVFPNEPTMQVSSVSFYSDGSVTRGLLVKFRLQSGSGGSFATNWDGQLLYELGGAIGNTNGPPITPLPLSAGDGTLDHGGAGATLNLADDSLDGCFVKYNNANLLSHGAPAGAGFIPGEPVTSSGTGVGTIVTVDVANNRLGITVSAGAFLNLETITGGTSLTNAVLSANGVGDWEYQVIVDTDVIGAADYAWLALAPVTIQAGTARPPVVTQTWTGALSMIQVPRTPSTLVPESTISPNAQQGVLTASIPESTISPNSQQAALASQPAQTTLSPNAQEVTQGDYPANVQARVPARAHSQPGWVNLEVDGGAAGGDQPTVNLLDSTSGDSGPEGAQSGTKAELKLSLRPLNVADVGVLVRSAPIDLAAPGDTAIYTVPSDSQGAVVFGASVRCLTATGVTVPATASLGFDAGVSNLFSSQLLVNLKVPSDAYDYPVGGELVVAPAGSLVSLRVVAAANGPQAGEALLFGYLL
jgi:hypothetical protein